MVPRPAESCSPTPLQPAQLPAVCPALRTAASLCVAFSGGLDSTVLLHLLVQLRNSGQLAGHLRAIHINHGLQVAAAQWTQHCRAICDTWQVPLAVVDVNVALPSGESLEAAARHARYAAFAQHLQAGEHLVQAHHQDDQAETVLQRLLRGSGVRGLAGIPVQRELAQGVLLRPLLQVSRATLQRYAEQQQLGWVDDPSNRDERFDRNYLRNSVIPALAARWPGASASLARSAALQRDAASLLDELARDDWQRARQAFPNRLSLATLRSLSAPRARNLLGYWLSHQPEGLQVGPAPLYGVLQRCMEELVLPRDDDYRQLGWGEGAQTRCLHRYRDALYLLKPLPAPPQAMPWPLPQSLQLPEPLGSLQWQTANGTAPANLTVRFRQGGEVFAMPSGQHKTLKNFLQERGVPPWLRDHVPLIYQHDTLLAVGEIFLRPIDSENASKNHHSLCWKRTELFCGY